MRRWLFFTILTLSLGACSYNHGKPGADSSSASTQPSADLVANMSFSQVYSEVFANKCASCHNDTTANGTVNLAHPETAKSALYNIQQSALIQKTMPKEGSPPLTNQEIMILTAWVQAGGPNQAGENNPPPPLPPLGPTFYSISKNILERKCVQCHNPTGVAKDDPFQTFAELSGSDAVVAGKSALSDLYNVILPTAKKPMPPPSSGEALLSADEVQAIKEWIDNGAKD